jgi:abhydrolase domain-containing protein 6
MTRRRILLALLLLLVAAAAVVYFVFPEVPLRLAERAELGAAGLHRESVVVGGDRVVYLVGGHGETLLLLPGFGADKSNWVRAAKYLTPHFRVIAPDLPGFGESTRDEHARYAVEDQVDRVQAFARRLGLDTVHIGGNSMGGAIAGAYAARHREAVRSLWLLDPGGVRSARRSELEERLARGDNPLLVQDVDGFERLLDFVFVERPPIPRPIERYLARQAMVHRPFNEKVARDLAEKPIALESVLRGVSVPTLILWGDRDRLVDVSGAAILRSAMPNAQVVVLRGVGHVPMVERPEESANAFLAFRGLRSSSDP